MVKSESLIIYRTFGGRTGMVFAEGQKSEAEKELANTLGWPSGL